MTVSDMYLDSCAPLSEEAHCERCNADAAHRSQSRIWTEPNVLVVQVRRGPEVNGQLVRVPVSVEEQLSLPGLPDMTLVGVVYHNGVTLRTGHYTCVCRGPGGRFWYYDDDKPVQRMEKEVALIKPKEVYMVVYCRRDGSSRWAPGAVDEPCVDVEDPDGASAGGAGGADGGSAGSGAVAAMAGSTPSKRRFGKKTSVTDAEPEPRGVVVSGGAAAVGTPSKRRLGKKTSTDAEPEPRRVGGSPVIQLATTPERAAKKRQLDASPLDGAIEEIDASPDAGVRRLASNALEPLTPSRRVRKKTTMVLETPCAEQGAVVGVASPSRDAVSAPPALASPSRRVCRNSATSGESPGVPVHDSNGSDGCAGALPKRRRSGGVSSEVSITQRSMSEVPVCADTPAALEATEGLSAGLGGGKSRGRGRGGGRGSSAGRGVCGQVGTGRGATGEEAQPLRRSSRVAARAVDQPGSSASAHTRVPAAVSRRDAVPVVANAARIVTGFGSERIEDVAADERRRVAEGAQRGDRRRETGTRGRMTTSGGEDLDRSAGGAWHAGRR